MGNYFPASFHYHKCSCRRRFINKRYVIAGLEDRIFQRAESKLLPAAIQFFSRSTSLAQH